jgi:hypothetical protein
MPIGEQPNVAQLNSQAAQIAIQFRNTAIQAVEMQGDVTALGQAGLVALGFASADATAFIAQCNYLATVAQVIQGTATQGTLFNFVNAWLALTGPD